MKVTMSQVSSLSKLLEEMVARLEAEGEQEVERVDIQFTHSTLELELNEGEFTLAITNTVQDVEKC